MEKLATSLHPSLYSISRRSLKSTPQIPRRFRFVRVCSNLKADQTTKSKRIRVLEHPGSAKSHLELLDAIGYESDLEDAVASLEEAFKQASRSENINFVTDDQDGAPTIKSSRKKRRLDLQSRINLKNLALEQSEQKSTSDDDIWSPEADELLRSSRRIGVEDWRKVHHSFLSLEEEQKIVGLIEPAKSLEKLRDDLQRDFGRKPGDDEWARAANISYKTLRRKLQLGQAAKNKLIQQHNYRLVLFVARKYKRDAGSFTLDDLCQEGLRGLMNASEHFNPNKGSRFSTYAVFWIRATVLRAIAKSGQIIRFPLRFAAKRMELRKARRQLIAELGRIPTHEEVMERAGMDEKQYWAIYNSKLRVRSLNDEVGGTGEELQDYLAETGEIVTNTFELRAELEKLLDDLKPKARMVLRHRYGLEDGVPEMKSLREVGRRLNMSQEMVRKYEASALQQLKQKPEALSYIRQCLPSTTFVQKM